MTSHDAEKCRVFLTSVIRVTLGRSSGQLGAARYSWKLPSQLPREFS
jgi:hypothetical protein